MDRDSYLLCITGVDMLDITLCHFVGKHIIRDYTAFYGMGGLSMGITT